MTTMTVADAMRVAEIFEADDLISVPAMACRILARYAKQLENDLAEVTPNMRGSDVDTPLQK